jgi:hypothetical protein
MGIYIYRERVIGVYIDTEGVIGRYIYREGVIGIPDPLAPRERDR